MMLRIVSAMFILAARHSRCLLFFLFLFSRCLGCLDILNNLLHLWWWQPGNTTILIQPLFHLLLMTVALPCCCQQFWYHRCLKLLKIVLWCWSLGGFADFAPGIPWCGEWHFLLCLCPVENSVLDGVIFKILQGLLPLVVHTVSPGPFCPSITKGTDVGSSPCTASCHSQWLPDPRAGLWQWCWGAGTWPWLPYPYCRAWSWKDGLGCCPTAEMPSCLTGWSCTVSSAADLLGWSCGNQLVIIFKLNYTD